MALHGCRMTRPLSDVFRARADELGLSAEDLASRMGVTHVRVRQLLKAKHLREDTANRLCAALGLRLEVVIAAREVIADAS